MSMNLTHRDALKGIARRCLPARPGMGRSAILEAVEMLQSAASTRAGSF